MNKPLINLLSVIALCKNDRMGFTKFGIAGTEVHQGAHMNINFGEVYHMNLDALNRENK